MIKWYADALCAHVDPSIFFAEKARTVVRAKSICGHCTVRRECLAEAVELKDEFGVRAGLSADERLGLPAPVKREGTRCGTRAGYLRHRRRDEPTCEPCRKAERVYAQAQSRIRAIRQAVAA